MIVNLVTQGQMTVSGETSERWTARGETGWAAGGGKAVDDELHGWSSDSQLRR